MNNEPVTVAEVEKLKQNIMLQKKLLQEILEILKEARGI